ncbi:MAG: hypothetical protein GXY03_11425 [Solirubrobacterales bacterium]|nr:hypothetical protein [Solirubrobacterales bacterium]
MGRLGKLAPVLAAALATTALASGCSLEDPYEQRDREAAARDALGEPPRGGDVRTDAPLAEPDPGTFPGAAGAPEETLARAARLAGNWTSETAPEVFGRLVGLSAGNARAQFELIAAQAESEAQRRAAATATAVVEAVVVRGSGDRRRGLAVTRERMATPSAGELPEEYRVTVATLERRGDAWVITEWEPKQ